MIGKTDSTRNHCIRCGKCCLKSSPVLHIQDIALFTNNSIHKSKLYTIRKGELVKDPIKHELIATPHELIKLKELENIRSGCIYFDKTDNGCIIYKNRPSQCSALKCWDTEDFMVTYNSPKLERRDIIEDGTLLGLIAEHEKRCSYSLLKNLVEQINNKGEKVLDETLEILRFDHQIRPFISKKLDLKSMHMDLYFGRPLTETISMFGLQVEQKSDGTFLLTMIG